MMAKFTYPIDDPHDLLGTAERRIDALEAELKEERYATEQFRRANEGLAASKEKLEVALSIAMSENQRLTKHVEDYEEENANLVERSNRAMTRAIQAEAKLTAIECGDCHKTMLECECDMENG